MNISISRIHDEVNKYFVENRIFCGELCYNLRMARKPKSQPPEEPKPPAKMGRPPFNWTRELEDFIISGVLANKSMRQIELDGEAEYGKTSFPSSVTIKNYLASNDDFLNRYARAKDLSQDFMAEDLVDIIDGRHPDFIDAELSQRKESIETRKWIMGKLRRKKWGEVKHTEITGADGAPLLQPQVINARDMNPEARAALYNALQLATAQYDAEEGEYTEEENNDQ